MTTLTVTRTYQVNLSPSDSPLKSLRLTHGLTLKEFADIAQIHYTYLSKIERGRHQAPESALKRISSVLNVNFKDLCYEVGVMPQEDIKIFIKKSKALRPLLNE